MCNCGMWRLDPKGPHIMKTGPLGVVSPSDRIKVDAPVLVEVAHNHQQDRVTSAPAEDPAPIRPPEQLVTAATTEAAPRPETSSGPASHPSEDVPNLALAPLSACSGRALSPQPQATQAASRGQNLFQALRRAAAAVLLFLIGRHS